MAYPYTIDISVYDTTDPDTKVLIKDCFGDGIFPTSSPEEIALYISNRQAWSFAKHGNPKTQWKTITFAATTTTTTTTTEPPSVPQPMGNYAHKALTDQSQKTDPTLTTFINLSMKETHPTHGNSYTIHLGITPQ